jgi:small-conductance mechanosensitive channel
MDFLEQTLLGNSYQSWLAAAGVGIVAVLVMRILQAIVRHRLAKLAASTETRWDDYAVSMLSGTRLLFWMIFGVFVGSHMLDVSTRAQVVIRGAFVIALLVQGGLWGSVLIRSFLSDYRKKKLDENPADVTTLGVISFVAKTTLWSVVSLLVLDNLGIDVTALVAGLGIGGVAVALALQNVLGDLFASLSIVMDKPFLVGDFLMIDDFLGSVERIGLKTTRLRSLSGEQLIFSNTDLLRSRIHNFGRMYERRVVFSLGVTYQTPREKLKRIPGIIREAVEGEENTRFDRSHFMKYADYSLNFETVYYVLKPDYNVYMDIQQSIYFKIHEAFEREGIEFAYPTQTLYVGDRNGAETTESA